MSRMTTVFVAVGKNGAAAARLIERVPSFRVFSAAIRLKLACVCPAGISTAAGNSRPLPPLPLRLTTIA